MWFLPSQEEQENGDLVDVPENQWTKYVDPGLSLMLVLLILKSVWPLLIESALILLQTVPTHIQVDSLQQKLMAEVDGILAVHEFHIWQLAGDRIIASAHIRCLNLSEYMKVAENIKEFFHNNGIHSTTIQPEFLDTNGYVIHGDGIESDERERSDKIMNDSDCALTCPKDEEKLEPNCQASKCCPDPKQARSEPSTPKLTNKDARSSWRRSSFGYDTGGGGGPTAVVTSTPGS